MAHHNVLPSLMGVSECDEDDLYAGLDWLLERQERIEQKLAKRGYNRDGLTDHTATHY